MRPNGTPKQLERRRRHALSLLAQGHSIKAVCQRTAASFSAVFRWREAARKGGVDALRAKPIPGRPRKLGAAKLKKLLRVLQKGALAYGFPNDLWTLKRIAAVIRKTFGVQYHPHHVWRVLRNAHWSCQVPERRAVQRDDDAIARWKHYQWPHIKKSPKTWGPFGFSR